MHLAGADPRWLQSIEVQGSGLIVRRILSVGVRSLRQRPSLAAPSPIVLHSAIWYCVGACRQVLWLSGPARGLYGRRNTDPLFYTVYGDDIPSAVQLQPPFTFDVACVLTLLQEELVDPSHRRELRKWDSLSRAKFVLKEPLPLPLPPRLDKPLPLALLPDD